MPAWQCPPQRCSHLCSWAPEIANTAHWIHQGASRGAGHMGLAWGLAYPADPIEDEAWNLYWGQASKALLSPSVFKMEGEIFPGTQTSDLNEPVQICTRRGWPRAPNAEGPLPLPSSWQWFSTISKGRVPPTALRTTLPPAPWLSLDVSQWRINQVQPPDMEAWRFFHDRGRHCPQAAFLTLWMQRYSLSHRFLAFISLVSYCCSVFPLLLYSHVRTIKTTATIFNNNKVILECQTCFTSELVQRRFGLCPSYLMPLIPFSLSSIVKIYSNNIFTLVSHIFLSSCACNTWPLKR